MENVQSKENQIISGVIWKQLLIFFFPIVLGTFFQQIYNTADAVVVGRFVGTEALAAVGGSTSQIINLIVGFFVGLSSGATVVISQYYGAREKQGLQNALHTAFAFSVVGSVVISVIGIWLSPMMLRWMNTTEEVIAPSTTYLRIYFAGIIFVFIYNVGSSILRAVGDSRRPLYYLIVCCFINILLDAGVKRTYLLDRPLAAALGVGMDLRQRYGRMIVDMGAGITDIAVISEGEIVQSSSVYYAGDYFDDAIVRYIRKKYSLLIGERTAEQIKINIGTAMKPETDEANLAMPVVGRNQLSGLPRTQEIHAAEIYEALKDPVAALIGSIQDVLVRTPPQLASDIFDDGIVLSGGAAGLARLPEAIYTALHIPCGVADDPQTSVVLGCGIAVEDPGAYASLLDDGRKGFKRL